MAGLVDFEYDFFDDYQSDVLADLPTIEQLVRLDDEVANKATIARYEGPVDAVEWQFLESYYSHLFADFITDRINGLIDPTPVERNRDRFNTFRHNIAELNNTLPRQRRSQTGVISKPAETVLLKQLRQEGFDPSTLDITHVGDGGGLYLLELFVTAAQQEALSGTQLLTALLDDAAALGDMGREEALARLRNPVLMVSLWENQAEGVERWLANDRSGILEMATATGKTVTGIAAIAECCGVLPDDPTHTPRTDDANIMVVAHSNAILKQWEREIQEKLGLPRPAGEVSEKADQLSFNGGMIEFYTAQSLLPQYDRDLANEYDLVIYDEVHHYSNVDGYGAAIDRPNYRAALGLSATIGDDGDLKRNQLTDLLGDVVYTYGVEKARRDGIIPEFDWTVHPTPLDPYEREEWEETTESISDQFKQIRYATETTELLKTLPVPFTELDDLGDFIRAHEAAAMQYDDDQIPDSWSNLQATIHSRTWIRHRSQPKIEGAIDLARRYLEDPEQPVKLVVFAMDIATADRIADELGEVTDDVYRAHSQLENSSRKNNQRVQQNIDAFANCENGVLVSPRMLDEGIDVPDAEVGINVAGTKTKLQLVQRMGRVLRKHGDQRPHFHHFIAIPDENYIAGLDSKEYVQELNWVRELGETIGVQPVIEEAGVDADLLERAEQRGHELWARDLLDDLEIETVQGNVHLDQILGELTVDAVEILLEELALDQQRLSQDDWSAAMDALRAQDALTVDGLQRVWWLFPLYRERPAELDDLLTAARGELEEDSGTTTPADEESESGAASGRTSTTSIETDKTDNDDTTGDTRGERDDDGLSPVPTPASIPIADQLDVQKPDATTSDHDTTTTATAIDDDLLHGTGAGGLLSTGYLHERPLASYLHADEHPQALLASTKHAPTLDVIDTGQSRSLDLGSDYRAITALTETRAICVVGDEPTNHAIQIRYEGLTAVDVEESGSFLRKTATLVLGTEEQRLAIPDGTGTDLQAVADSIRAAAYRAKLTAGWRLVDAAGAVATTGDVDAIRETLRAARHRFKQADEWSSTQDPGSSEAGNAITFVTACLDRLDELREAIDVWHTVRADMTAAQHALDENDTTQAREIYANAATELDTLLDADTNASNAVRSAASSLRDQIASRTDIRDDAAADEPDDDATGNSSEQTTSEHDDETVTPSKESLLEALRALADDVDGVPKATEMDANGSYSTHEYYRAFSSWDDALAAAGLDKEAALIEELQRVAADLGEPPSASQIDDHARYSSGMYTDTFGGVVAAREAADVDDLTTDSSPDTSTTSDDTMTVSNSGTEPSRDDLIEAIQSLDTGDRLVPYASDMDEHDEYTAYNCQELFGSWDAALAVAGIDKQARLLDELRRVRDVVGRRPKTTDMNHHGQVSASMYTNYFGSWSDAIAHLDNPTPAGAEPGTTDGGASSQSADRLTPDNPNVLVRDDIPNNERLPDVLAIKIVAELPTNSSRVDGRYRVEDLDDQSFEFKVWQTHEIEVAWTVGDWYLLTEARGKTWERDGETQYQLSSTKDLGVVSCDGYPTTAMLPDVD